MQPRSAASDDYYHVEMMDDENLLDLREILVNRIRVIDEELKRRKS